MGGSSFYNILTQYPDSNGPPLNHSVFGGDWTDTTAFPAPGTYGGYSIINTDVQASVARAIAANPGWWPPGLQTVYRVFTGYFTAPPNDPVKSCYDTSGSYCSQSGYCAYHYAFMVAGAWAIYAYDPYLIPGLGCGAANLPPGNPNAQLEVNTLAHEQFEAASDPLPDWAAGWFDFKNGEMADICQGIYGTLGADNANITLKGHRYKIQGIWSNATNTCAWGYYSAFAPISARP